MKLLCFISAFFVFTGFADPVIAQEQPSDFIQNQTLICKDFISQSSKSKFPLNGLEGTVLMFTACSKEEITQNLSNAEKKYLDELAAQINHARIGLSQKELEGLKAKENLVNSNWEKLKKSVKPRDISKLTKQEMNDLDNHLKSIWRKMREALSKDDIESAVSYFDDRSQESYRMQFKTLPAEARQKVAREMEEIYFEQVRGNSAIYDFYVTREGKRYSFQLTFSQDIEGKWKILSY